MRTYTFRVHFESVPPGSGKPPAAIAYVAMKTLRGHGPNGAILVSSQCISAVEFRAEIARLKTELDALEKDAAGKFASYEHRILRRS